MSVPENHTVCMRWNTMKKELKKMPAETCADQDKIHHKSLFVSQKGYTTDYY